MSTRSALRRYAPNYAVLAIAEGIALFGLYLLPALPDHLFIVHDNLGAIDTFNAYPLRTEIMPTWLLGIITIGAGLLVIGGAQVWVRSGKDFHHGFFGLLTSLAVGSWFQVICKVLIGGVRPNLLAVCQPDLARVSGGQGFGGLFYDKLVCTGNHGLISDALKSFPSGHSTCAFSGLVYLSLYLNAKTKLFGHEYARVWKLFLVVIPILAATVLSLTRLLDNTHHSYDILVGAIIGGAFAAAAYRSQYCSISNPKNNHHLLPPSPSYQ